GRQIRAWRTAHPQRSSPYRARRGSAGTSLAGSRACFALPTLSRLQTARRSLQEPSAQTRPPALAASASTNSTRAITEWHCRQNREPARANGRARHTDPVSIAGLAACPPDRPAAAPPVFRTGRAIALHASSRPCGLRPPWTRACPTSALGPAIHYLLPRACTRDRPGPMWAQAAWQEVPLPCRREAASHASRIRPTNWLRSRRLSAPEASAAQDENPRQRRQHRCDANNPAPK